MSTLSAHYGIQKGLPGMCAIEEAVSVLSSSGTEVRGAIFTKREVADFILDLVGYTSDKDLRKVRLLEPSFGAGNFLFPALDRLLESWTQFGNRDNPTELLDSIQAVESHRETVLSTQFSPICCFSSISSSRIPLFRSRTATPCAGNW